MFKRIKFSETFMPRWWPCSVALMGYFLLMHPDADAQGINEPNYDLTEFYREDQFYFALNYDLLSDVPEEVAIRGLIGGIHFGFIRDWPVSSKGNWSLGTGIGLGYDRFGSNIVVRSSPNQQPNWTIEQSPSAIEANSLQLTTMEFPLEIRWRSSSAKTYKFWRFYTGLKWSQNLLAKTVYKSPLQSETVTDLPQLRSGIWYTTLSFGYGTFNAQIQWGLSPMLEGVYNITTEQSIGIRPIKLGIMFYLL